jgi:hypothetical protein
VGFSMGSFAFLWRAQCINNALQINTNLHRHALTFINMHRNALKCIDMHRQCIDMHRQCLADQYLPTPYRLDMDQCLVLVPSS